MMMRKSEPGFRQAGFTLLEVLIAATLMAVMMTLLLGALRIGVRSWATGDQRSASTSRMLVTQSFLRSHLSAALPLNRGPAKPGTPPPLEPQTQLLFEGGKDFLRYVGTLPPVVKGGLYQFEMYLKRDQERSDLKMVIKPLASGSLKDEPEPIDDVLLLENVEFLKINYFVHHEEENTSRWTNEWKADAMPALIRIELSVLGEPAWPAMIIAPRIQTQPAAQ